MAQVAMIFNHNLMMQYILLICCGMTFAGKNVVGFTLICEFMHQQSWKEGAVVFFLYAEPVLALYIEAYFEFVSKDWLPLHIQYTVAALVSTVLIMVFVPESPPFLYSQGQFRRAREAILKIAEFNGVTHDGETGQPMRTFRFDKEVIMFNMLHRHKILGLDSDAQLSEMDDEVRSLTDDDYASRNYNSDDYVPSIMPSDSIKETINNTTYKINIVRMAILWSSASFCFFMMQLFNKYLEGGIFYNFTLDQLAMIIGVTLGTYLYNRF